MAKVKREEFSPVSPASASSHSTGAGGGGDDEQLELDMMNSPASSETEISQPAKKKQKTTLNPFSIEAIMQQGSRTSSSSTSSSSSSIELNNDHHNNNNNNHHQHHHHQLHHIDSIHLFQQHKINSSSSGHPRSSCVTTPTSSLPAAPATSSSSSSAATAAAAGGCANHQAGGSSTTTPGNTTLSRVECTLDNKDMWDKFHSLNTEMIITKTGRRMFPVMKVQFHNLDPNARYAVSMDIVPVDNKRYRYAYHKSCWQVAGKADPSAEPRLYPHPDSPFNGDLLSRQVISFEKVKLTNNEMDKSGHIILNSMHKYQPRVHLIEIKQQPTTNGHNAAQQHFLGASSTHHHQHKSSTSTYSDRSQTNHHNHQQQQQAPQLDIEDWKIFKFPETVFTAVTAYQNQLITKMKIDKNPFAKGFRDSSRLSDLDRNDPFDYMGPLGQSGRFGGPGGQSGGPTSGPGSLDGPPGSHMDAFQLLAASAANNPWYSPLAMAAAASGGSPNGPGGNPFGLMGVCGSAQAAQLQTQMMLAAFSAYINGGAAAAAATASATAAAGTSNTRSPEDK